MSEFVVEVNEGVVEASRQGVEFWLQHRPRFAASGQLAETVAPCIIGGRVELGPYDRETADFMADHMTTTGGMPGTAVRVKRPSLTAKEA